MSRKKKRGPVAYSRISVKSQTVIPRAVREALAVAPGDTVRYSFTEAGIVIEKAPVESDDPFASFSEWAGANDDEAYAGL
jgi:antitoxin PrlF